jgi:hypothetical protein
MYGNLNKGAKGSDRNNAIEGFGHSPSIDVGRGGNSRAAQGRGAVEVRLLRSERQDAPGRLTPGAPFLIVDGITAKSRDDYLCVEVPLGGILQAKGLLLKLPPRVMAMTITKQA